MLKHAHEAVKKSYYDATFQGLDWDARYAEYLAKIDSAPHLGGGLRRMVSNLFSTNVEIGTRVARGSRIRVSASTRGNRAFTGPVFVLIDAASGSSSELLARVVQLEGRGTVIGDRSSGAVRESLVHPFSQGADVMIFYQVAVTTADILMKDGVSPARSTQSPPGNSSRLKSASVQELATWGSMGVLGGTAVHERVGGSQAKPGCENGVAPRTNTLRGVDAGCSSGVRLRSRCRRWRHPPTRLHGAPRLHRSPC